MTEREFEQLPMLLTVADLQKILGIGRSAAYDLIYQKKFPILRLGERQIRIPKDKLLDWINSNLKTHEIN